MSYLDQTSKNHRQLLSGFFPFVFTPILNLFFLLLLFFIIAPYVVQPVTARINLPKTITSDFIAQSTASITITITSEDIIYLKNTVLTVKELKNILNQSSSQIHSILIKADRRSSLARIIDIWNICRQLGIEHVNIATPLNS